ncbi:MAG TPA: DUF4402 domain-containing protein [Sphingomicrobium sp.]|nr:DUF4402 domain-containing protein [Sphingomicrobium sp.]
MRQRARSGLAAISIVLAAALAAAPAHAANKSAAVSAKVVKPLTLKWVQNLDLGTIVLGPGTWSNATVGITRTGLFSCANSNVTCSGTTQVATYNVAGSNNQTARISAPNVTLVNQNDPSKTLTLVVDNPGTVFIPNSGNPGVNFSLGGSITLSSSTAGGVYVGTFNVTVDY